MLPVRHSTNNDVLRPPAGATPEECAPLPITRVRYEPSGWPAVVSYWQPSPGQLQLLAEGKPIRLSVIGQTHPPLAIGVDGDEGTAP